MDRKSEVRILTALSGLLKSLTVTMLMSFLLDVIFGLSIIPSIFVFNAVTLVDTDGDKDTSTPTIPNSAQLL